MDGEAKLTSPSESGTLLGTNSSISLRIKTVDERLFNVTLGNKSSVPQLKEKIASLTGIVTNRQRLIFRGKVLKNDQNISFYSLEDGHTLHLVVRPETTNSQNPDESSSNTNVNQSTTSQDSGNDPRINPQVSRVLMGATITIPEGSDIDMPLISSMITNIFNSIQSEAGVTNSTSGSRNAPRGINQINNRDSNSGIPQRNRRRRSQNTSTRSSAEFGGATSRLSTLMTRIETLLAEDGNGNEALNPPELSYRSLSSLQHNLRLLFELVRRAQRRVESIPLELNDQSQISTDRISGSVSLLASIGELCSCLAQVSLRMQVTSRNRNIGTDNSIDSSSNQISTTGRVISVPTSVALPGPTTTERQTASRRRNRESLSDGFFLLPQSIEALVEPIYNAPSDGSHPPPSRSRSTSIRSETSSIPQCGNGFDLPRLWKGIIEAFSAGDLISIISADSIPLHKVFYKIFQVLMLQDSIQVFAHMDMREWSKEFVDTLSKTLHTRSIGSSIAEYITSSGAQFVDVISQTLHQYVPDIAERILRSSLVQEGDIDRFSAEISLFLEQIIVSFFRDISFLLKKGKNAEESDQILNLFLQKVFVHFGANESLVKFIVSKFLDSSLGKQVKQVIYTRQVDEPGSFSSSDANLSSKRRRRK